MTDGKTVYRIGDRTQKTDRRSTGDGVFPGERGGS